jgi:hypothetical protein
MKAQLISLRFYAAGIFPLPKYGYSDVTGLFTSLSTEMVQNPHLRFAAMPLASISRLHFKSGIFRPVPRGLHPALPQRCH